MGVARQGFRAAVEFVHLFSFSTFHIYLRKKPGYSPGRPFLRDFVCIWPLKLNNKLLKITRYDTQAALDVTECKFTN